MSWLEFWNRYADTFGVTAVFSALGSGFLLWRSAEKKPLTRGRVLMVVLGGLLVSAITTAMAHGYLGLSIFLAPLLGTICGLTALPLMSAVMKGGDRVEERAPDIADKGIDLLPGRKD